MPDRDPALFSRENTASRASYLSFSRISSGYEIMIHNNNKNYTHIRAHLAREVLIYYNFVILHIL